MRQLVARLEAQLLPRPEPGRERPLGREGRLMDFLGYRLADPAWLAALLVPALWPSRSGGGK